LTAQLKAAQPPGGHLWEFRRRSTEKGDLT
jgi:hypothetical protein